MSDYDVTTGERVRDFILNINEIKGFGHLILLQGISCYLYLIQCIPLEADKPYSVRRMGFFNVRVLVKGQFYKADAFSRT